MWNWLLDLFGSRGHGIDELERRLGLSFSEIKSVDRSYHEFKIRKKSGKFRRITAPNADLKSLQRRLLRRLFAKLSVHPKATGFEKGLSFIDNARCHQCQEVVIKIDLVDFFPSITSKRIEKYFRLIGWNRKTARLLTDLTTHAGALPQGAPTSPRLSNLVNRSLDARLTGLAQAYDGIYTRYADDITLSFGADLYVEANFILSHALTIVRQQGYRPHIGKKLTVRRSHQRQTVTGLVVNERANLPRETRRWLRAVEHRTKKFREGGALCLPPTLTKQQLQGWRSLQNSLAETPTDKKGKPPT